MFDTRSHANCPYRHWWYRKQVN